MIKFRKIAHDVESMFPVLVAKFAEHPEIDLLYLYGSRAGGRISPLSDVDLAVLLSPTVYRSAHLDIQLRMVGEAAKALRTDEVDVQILNGLPVQAQYAILKNNKVLFCRDESSRVDFEAEVISRYLDFEPFVEEHYRAMYQRIRSHANAPT
jgi:predicted nucleotidyltransferase